MFLVSRLVDALGFAPVIEGQVKTDSRPCLKVGGTLVVAVERLSSVLVGVKRKSACKAPPVQNWAPIGSYLEGDKKEPLGKLQRAGRAGLGISRGRRLSGRPPWRLH